MHAAAPLWVKELKATSVPSTRVFEYIKYDCTYTTSEGYREKGHHGFRVELTDLPENSAHNLTLIIKSPEDIMKISPQWDEARIVNASSNGRHLVTASFKGKQLALYVWLEGRSDTYPDPFDLMILPEGLSCLPIDQNGRVCFDISLISTQAVRDVDLVVEPFSYPASEIEDFSVRSDLNVTHQYSHGTSAWAEIQSVAAGNHKLRFEMFYRTLKGNLQVRASYRLFETLTFSLECYLDGEKTESSKSISVQYSTSGISFLKAVVPWIYGYEGFRTYLINFQSVKDFVLRIDRGNREQIDSILLSSNIEDFWVTDSSAYDNPCYELTFSIDKPSNTSIGLMLHSKHWFLIPGRIRLDDVPKEILGKYMNPSSSHDGEYIDKDNPLIKAWSTQVAGEEKNLYNIAYLLFSNLTNSLRYSKLREGFRPEMEFASATLRDKEGVCRHFARAFAALCLAKGLPVRTVLGTCVFAFNQTYKKNHEWNEVYFPGYGWVPVDITHRVFGSLSDSNMVYTFWEHIGNWTIILSERELSRARQESQLTLLKLVSIVNKKIDDLTRLRQWVIPVGHDFWKSIRECKMLLSQAQLLIVHDIHHEAILTISKAYVLLTRVIESTRQDVLIVFTMVAILVAVVHRRRQRRSRLSRLGLCRFRG